MNYSADSDLLIDNVILVTGAGEGLGAAVAKSYALHGATVVLLDRSIKALEKIYDEIEAAGGAIPVIYPLDLKGANADDYATMVASITDSFGRLDGLVHCAAVLGQIAPIEHQDIAKWLESIHINLTAPYLLTRACVPLLKQQSHSAIIFSSDDHKDTAYWSAYGIAKSGIEGLSMQLADEFESEGRVRVNCIIPGPVQTNLYTRAFPGVDPSSLPMVEVLTPTYLYLMGKDSFSVNGKCLSAQ